MSYFRDRPYICDLLPLFSCIKLNEQVGTMVWILVSIDVQEVTLT